MLGNVAQWIDDCWNTDLRTVPEDGAARTSGDCDSRVVRGGGWSAEPIALRSAARGYEVAKTRAPHIGFRVARVLAQ